VCAYFVALLNGESAAAGVVVARFLEETCSVDVPRGANACACLQVRPAADGIALSGRLPSAFFLMPVFFMSLEQQLFLSSNLPPPTTHETTNQPN
jgi:hypothetical protein